MYPHLPTCDPPHFLCVCFIPLLYLNGAGFTCNSTLIRGLYSNLIQIAAPQANTCLLRRAIWYQRTGNLHLTGPFSNSCLLSCLQTNSKRGKYHLHNLSMCPQHVFSPRGGVAVLIADYLNARSGASGQTDEADFPLAEDHMRFWLLPNSNRCCLFGWLYLSLVNADVLHLTLSEELY